MEKIESEAYFMKKRHLNRLLSLLTVVAILLGMVIPVSAVPSVRFELDTVVLTDGIYT